MQINFDRLLHRRRDACSLSLMGLGLASLFRKVCKETKLHHFRRTSRINQVNTTKSLNMEANVTREAETTPATTDQEDN
jgi:hypothetical protein